MKIIPQALLKKFDRHMAANNISTKIHRPYQKWLRYYIDYCDKYGKDLKNPQRLPDFINKLREKNQPKDNQKQAY